MARSSNRAVLDAIFDQVERKDAPPASGAAALFRARALDGLDVAKDVDARLVLVSRKSWLAIASVGVLVLAGTIWAGFTPSIDVVTGSGRVTEAGVILLVPESGASLVAPGARAVILGIEGEVSGRGSALLPERASEQLTAAIDGTEPVVPLVITLPTPLPAGTAVSGEVVIDESTVLRRMLGGS